MPNRHVKFGWKIPNRFGKIATSPPGGYFFTHTVLLISCLPLWSCDADLWLFIGLRRSYPMQNIFQGSKTCSAFFFTFQQELARVGNVYPLLVPIAEYHCYLSSFLLVHTQRWRISDFAIYFKYIWMNYIYRFCWTKWRYRDMFTMPFCAFSS